MKVALSRAVFWPQICDKLILKKVQVAGEAQQLRMSSYPRAGWRGSHWECPYAPYVFNHSSGSRDDTGPDLANFTIG